MTEYPGGMIGTLPVFNAANVAFVEHSNRRRRIFIKLHRVEPGCSAPPCDWCDETSMWLAYDIGHLTGASCEEHVGLLKHSVALSNGRS
jgi:hypothetical protein